MPLARAGSGGPDPDSFSRLCAALREAGIAFETWPSATGKSVRDLATEIDHGECELESRGGQLVRVLRVVHVKVSYVLPSGTVKVLRESHQTFRNGVTRTRGLRSSIAEKLKKGERPDSVAAKRAVREELGVVTVNTPRFVGKEAASGQSQSYPGIRMEGTNFYFEVELTQSEYKPHGYQETQENKISCFEWDNA